MSTAPLQFLLNSPVVRREHLDGLLSFYNRRAA
jgi:hypothetical protein